MYKYPFNVLLFIVTGILLIFGISSWGVISIILAAILFALWDIIYGCSDEAFNGSSPKELLERAHGARQYLQWFLAFYAIFLGMFLPSDDNKRISLLKLFNDAGVGPWMLLLPLFITCIAVLFVPIQIADDSGNATHALKGHMVLLAFLQKIGVFSFAYVVGKLFLFKV